MEKNQKSNIDFCAINKHCDINFLRKLFKVALSLPNNRSKKIIGIKSFSIVELITLGHSSLF